MKRIAMFAVIAALAAPLSAEELIKGTVAESMDSGGYTYLRLTQGAKSSWVAVPQMPIKKGQNVSLQNGMEMKGFESKTLKRKFDSIVFSPGPADGSGPGLPTSGMTAMGGGEMPAGHPPVGGAAKAAPAGHGAPAVAKDASAKTPKAEGPDAYTVAELFAKRGELKGKRAVVRGKVVKASMEIMGMNWLHLQDGSGDAKAGTHDLVVTTQDVAKKGDVVTAAGWVVSDKDFGAGYKYKVLVEKASIGK